MTEVIDTDDSPSRARYAPRSTAQWVALLVAVALLASVAAYALGRRTTAPGEDSLEVGFLRDMISHHEQALQLSLIEIRNGAHREIKSFAEEILRQQAFEVGLMTQKLESWDRERAEAGATAMRWMGHATPADEMPGMASEDEFAALGSAQGSDVDALFVRLMQDHHRGGVEMADYATKRTDDAFVKDLAARMRSVQRQEIAELEGVRARIGLADHPRGWKPAFAEGAATDDEDAAHGH